MSGDIAADSLGMLLIGFTIATWLFGANTLQTYVYFQKYNDGFLLKAVIAVVFVTDMLNTIFTCWGIYSELVPAAVASPHGSIPLVLQSTASDVVILVVQCFFARCVYHMSGRRNIWLTGTILVLTMMAFTSGIALTVVSVTSLYVEGKAIPMVKEVLVALALGLVTLTDVTITVSLAWYLVGVRASAMQSSHVDRLILYCIQRGILTTVSHAIVLALWFSLPQTWAWALFQFSLGKVYTLTFLTILNRRENMRCLNDHYPCQSHSGIKFQCDSQQGGGVVTEL